MTTEQFTSIVVPLDSSDLSDRAIPVAAELARRGGLPVILVTTMSPGLPASREAVELLERALEMRSCDVAVQVVESNDELGAALSPLLASLDAPLLCLATHGHTAVVEAILASGTQELLAVTGCPAVVVGPSADASSVPSRLLVCVGPDGRNIGLVSAAQAWQHTFGGVIAEIEVVTVSAGAHDAPEELIAATRRLAPRMVAAPLGRDPVRAVLDELDVRPAVAAVGSHLPRGLDRIVHGSVGWELIRSAPTPVLVVPAARPT